MNKELKFEIYSTTAISLLLSIPYYLFSEQTLEKYTYDIMILIIFISLSVGLFIKSKSTKHTILLKLFSIFIFFHFVFFPFVYVYLLNTNPNNIKIEKDVLDSEIISSYDNIDEIYGRTLLEKEKLINNILHNEKDFIKVKVNSLKLNQMLILKENIAVLNYSFETKGKHPRFFETFFFYNKKGEYITDLKIRDENILNIENLLKNELINVRKLQSLKKKEIEQVKTHKFWSYKNILPYSINIFYTSNFVPKSKISNIVYFIHNTFIFVIILSLIIGFLQNFFTNKIN
ncbi:hypothetical protein [Flavobacterium sp.]|uniref:hypothetical protein n=1 Tax=Flavobacterium sp. TaxID=239 RepID=UPI00286FA6FC|nr:hypothetical protein [Flavobacterium sp.]